MTSFVHLGSKWLKNPDLNMGSVNASGRTCTGMSMRSLMLCNINVYYNKVHGESIVESLQKLTPPAAKLFLFIHLFLIGSPPPQHKRLVPSLFSRLVCIHVDLNFAC